jgi:hypothetical protein
VIGKVPRYQSFISLFKARDHETDHDKSPQMSMRDEDMRTLQKLMHGYAATFGSPTCCLVPELLTTFPQAKLILHVRSSDEAWFRSFSSTIRLDFESGTWRARIYRLLTFSIRWMHPHHRLCDHMAEYWRGQYGDIGPRMHSAHNGRMKELVPKEQLLVYDVKEGWGPLCAFLDVPVPDVPFPRVNDSKEMGRIYLFMQVYGAAMWMLYASVLIGAISWLSRWT